MGFELEQFMYANFPTYMGAPWEMVQWLHDTAKGYEWQEMMKAQQDLVYNQGSSYTGGKKRGGYDEDIDTEESGFGQGVGKPKKKKGAQQQVQQAAPAKVPQKSIEKIK